MVMMISIGKIDYKSHGKSNGKIVIETVEEITRGSNGKKVEDE